VLTASAQWAWVGSHAATLPVPGAAPATLPQLLSPVVPIALGTWLLVGIARLASFILARQSLRRRLVDRHPVLDPAVASALRALAGKRPIEVSASRRIQTPMVIGRNELCLPSRALIELAPEELEAVLAHEIAHLRRRDDAWLTLATVVERLFFIQPLNALALRRLRAIAECSCDDWAVRSTRSPAALASALARVATWLAGAPVAPAEIGMASRESLALARVRRILDPNAKRSVTRWHPALTTAATLALVLVVLGVPGFRSRAIRYTIEAYDDAGPFTVTVERGCVIGMTINGSAVDQSRLQYSGTHLRVRDAAARITLDLTLTRGGGIRWTSRQPRVPVVH
jgi:beta-lactamase regulating signal transducer with metallopeptidase domain